MSGQIQKRFLRDESGVVAMVVALSLVIIGGVAALAVDVGYLYSLRNQLQAAADAAALAGASQLSVSDAEVLTKAKEYAGRNMPFSEHGTVLADADVVIGNWDSSTRVFTPADGVVTNNAVYVTTKRSSDNDNAAELFFARIFGFDETDITTTAVAWPGGSGQICILSLEPSDPSAIKASGTVDLDLGGCGIAVTSSDSTKAIELAGTVDITAGEICVAGGYDDPGTVTLTPGPEIVKEGCTPPPDPLASLPPPAVPNCPADHTAPGPVPFVVSGSGGTVNLTPGVYCGGIEISGSSKTVNFAAGEYILAGGGFKGSGGSNTYNGTGVMFYNTESSPGAGDFGDIDFSGNSTANLSAPTSGAYAGVLFFQDPTNSSDAEGVKFKFAGTVTATFDGVIYFPNQLVQYSGSSGVGDVCGPKIISKFIDFNGTSATFGPNDPSCASNNVSIGTVVLQLVY